MFGIFANVIETDGTFRTGAKVLLVSSNGQLRYQWHGLSRGGRRVTKYTATERLQKAEEVATNLTAFAESARNRRSAA